MASAFITELTNLYEAENNLKTHHTQLLLAKAIYNTTKGSPLTPKRGNNLDKIKL